MKTLYANGEIWCSRGRYTEAVLVENHTIIALGSDALSAHRLRYGQVNRRQSPINRLHRLALGIRFADLMSHYLS